MNLRHVSPSACALLLLLLAAPAHAQVCDARSSLSQITRENLQRAATDGDFPTAQDYSDRGRRNLDQLAATAGRCDCPAAQSRFEAAATVMRRTPDTENRKDLRAVVTQATATFDDGMGKLKECAKR